MILAVPEAVFTGFQKASTILAVTWKRLPANSVFGVPETPRGKAKSPGTAVSPGSTSCSFEGEAASTVKVDCAVVSTGANPALSAADNVVTPAKNGLMLLTVRTP